MPQMQAGVLGRAEQTAVIALTTFCADLGAPMPIRSRGWSFVPFISMPQAQCLYLALVKLTTIKRLARRNAG